MKSKNMLALVLPLALCACFGSNPRPVVTKTEYKVVEIDDKYFECNKVQLPNPDTLDDERVAKLIADLVAANRICGNNMNAIKVYIEAAKKVIEERDED